MIILKLNKYILGSTQTTCDPTPADVDCEGTYSACSAACEKGEERVFTETTAKSGNGKECPVAEDCKPGDGTCLGIMFRETRNSVGMNRYILIIDRPLYDAGVFSIFL